MSVSLFLPHEVPESALYILTVLYALVLVYLMCSANVSLGSRVRPRIIFFLLNFNLSQSVNMLCFLYYVNTFALTLANRVKLVR